MGSKLVLVGAAVLALALSAEGAEAQMCGGGHGAKSADAAVTSEAALMHREHLGLSPEQVRRLEQLKPGETKGVADVLTPEQQTRLRGMHSAMQSMGGMSGMGGMQHGQGESKGCCKEGKSCGCCAKDEKKAGQPTQS